MVLDTTFYFSKNVISPALSAQFLLTSAFFGTFSISYLFIKVARVELGYKTSITDKIIVTCWNLNNI